jgi:hypothetical protein
VTCDKSAVFAGLIPVSTTIKTDRHDITEVVLKVALSTINKPSTINKVILALL